MQSRNEENEIVQSVPVDLGKIEELAAKINAANEKGAKSHTIGNLPKKGDHLTVNGLSYRVEFADHVRGKFTVKMILRDK